MTLKPPPAPLRIGVLASHREQKALSQRKLSECIRVVEVKTLVTLTETGLDEALEQVFRKRGQ